MANETDGRVLALADGLRQANERIDALADAVGQLSGALAAAAEEVAGSPLRAVWWPDLEPAQRSAAWEDLLSWLDATLLPRRPDMGRLLGACWYRHPAVVDELTMLHATWHGAYLNPKAAPTAVAEWLDRWFPGARRRIEDDLKDCRRSHVDRAPGERIATSLPTGDVDRRAWAGGMPASTSSES